MKQNIAVTTRTGRQGWEQQRGGERPHRARVDVALEAPPMHDPATKPFDVHRQLGGEETGPDEQSDRTRCPQPPRA